jgi:hypothetical protein
MTIDIKKLNDQWLQWQMAHSTLARLIVVAESAAVGACVDLITNGVDFTTQGLQHAATIVGTTVVVAVRNYLKDNARSIKLRLADDKKTAELIRADDKKTETPKLADEKKSETP